MKISKQRDFINLYKRLLDDFSLNRTTNRLNKNKLYSLLFPVVGSKYKTGGIMVCGRSTNGWCWDWFKPWKINQITNKKHTIINESIEASKTEWVEEEFNTRSKFWKVARHLTLKSCPEITIDSDWTKHFVWTNLVKIAPASRGNPTNMEFNAQVNACVEILKYEIDFYSPKNLILLTDFDWSYDYIENLGFNPNEAKSSKYTQGNYQYKNTNIIVTVRPENKSLSKFNSSIEKLLKI